MTTSTRRRRRASRPRTGFRRAFNLVEMLIALAITSALLTATLIALDASFRAYQMTTEVASTHSVGRMVLHRILTLVRTSVDFGPFPANPLTEQITSDFIEFERPGGDIMTIEWDSDDEALYIVVDDVQYLLLEGVIEQLDEEGDPIPPFTLEYEKGRNLYRATVNLMLEPDDNQSVAIDGDNSETVHLVASAMPRAVNYED